MTHINAFIEFDQAVYSYQRGEADMQAAARYAGVSIYHLMIELEKRDITPPAAAEKFVAGLKALVETFGGSQALQRIGNSNPQPPANGKRGVRTRQAPICAYLHTAATK